MYKLFYSVVKQVLNEIFHWKALQFRQYLDEIFPPKYFAKFICNSVKYRQGLARFILETDDPSLV